MLSDGIGDRPHDRNRDQDDRCGREEVGEAPAASTEFGSLTVKLTECRYPAGNPAGDAYAHVTIRETNGGKLWFDGWMLASSPALNALEHPRYDVWVMRCTT